ncbi:MAG: 30S ribosomal protein S19e [Candidatus Methanomethylicia archaeon]
MVSVKDVPSEKLIRELAIYLRDNYRTISPPLWSKFVKTGAHRERLPQNDDWWWIRAASILRKIYLNQHIGVEKLRKMYGGVRNAGLKPRHFRKAGGKIIRLILQQLEKAELVKTIKGEGRILTPNGYALLDRISLKIFRETIRENPSLKKYAFQ